MRRRRYGPIGLICALSSIFAGQTHATPNGTWVQWANFGNGVPFATFPTLAYSPETNTLFYAGRFPSPSSDTLGSVWTCDMGIATPQFTKLPQTGFVLPIPKPGNSYTNVFSITTNAAGEPIVGTGAPGNNDPNLTNQTKLYRFDKATNQWVAPPLTALAGQNLPVLQPTNIMYQLTRGADGTIWGAGQWSKTYRSTDGGKNFTVFDEAQLLYKNYPNYYRLNYPLGAGSDGAVYGIRVAPNGYVYEGTETGGVIFSPDNGVSWQPLDFDSSNPNSTMNIASTMGNVAGIGFTKDGKVVAQGAPGTGSTDATHLYLFDPVNHTEQICKGIPDYFFGSQDVHTIMTLPDGAMFINSGRNTVANGSSTFGGILTSTDGLNWSMFNTGLTSAANADFRSSGPDSVVVINNDVFLSTTDGKIWKYNAGPMIYNATQQLPRLTVLSGDSAIINRASNNSIAVVSTPAIAIVGTLDLTSNDLVVQAPTTLSAVINLVQQGHIISSTAANDTNHITTLAVIQNTIANSTLDGQAVGVGDVLVKYTYFGDANLDGQVNGNDYTLIDNGFQMHSAGWVNGDFNYDGTIDGSDYSLIDNAFNRQTALITASVANEVAAVPEPTSIAGATAALLFAGFKRSRREKDSAL